VTSSENRFLTPSTRTHSGYSAHGGARAMPWSSSARAQPAQSPSRTGSLHDAQDNVSQTLSPNPCGFGQYAPCSSSRARAVRVSAGPNAGLHRGTALCREISAGQPEGKGAHVLVPAKIPQRLS
jgi:hypothetical protein